MIDSSSSTAAKDGNVNLVDIDDVDVENSLVGTMVKRSSDKKLTRGVNVSIMDYGRFG